MASYSVIALRITDITSERDGILWLFSVVLFCQSFAFTVFPEFVMGQRLFAGQDFLAVGAGLGAGVAAVFVIGQRF